MKGCKTIQGDLTDKQVLCNFFSYFVKAERNIKEWNR